MTGLGKGRAGHGHGRELGTHWARIGHEHGHGRDSAWSQARLGMITGGTRHGLSMDSARARAGWTRAGHGRIVSEGHKYPHRRDWARSRAALGAGTVTGETEHRLSTGLGTGTSGHDIGGLGKGGLCPNITGTH